MNFLLKYNLIFRVCCVLLLFILIHSFVKQSKYKLTSMSIIGQWRSISIKIAKHHGNDQKVTAIMEVDESTFPQKLNIRTLNTVFNNDGTYRFQYQNLPGNLTKASSGRWTVKEDSIFLKQDEPAVNLFKFKLKMQDSTATIVGFIDSDGEGRANDDCQAVLKKIN